MVHGAIAGVRFFDCRPVYAHVSCATMYYRTSLAMGTRGPSGSSEPTSTGEVAWLIHN